MTQAVVASLISAARKRSITNLVAEQAAAGLIAALAGFLLLLLAGSDALAWGWLVVLFGGGAAFSAWRTWKGLPSLYEVAQRIDGRLGLSDTLSTAIAFATKPSYSSDSAWNQQQQAAERASANLTPAQAVPLQAPRHAKWLGLLALATLALLGIRLGILGTLDLRQPLVAGIGDYLKGPDSPAALRAKNGSKAGAKDQGEDAKKQEEEKKEEAEAPKPPDDASGENQPGDPQNAKADQQGDKQQQADQKQDAEEQAQAANENSQQSGDHDANRDSNESEPAQQQASNKQNENQSLMDKVRDSLANMMSKLQPQKNQNNQKQSQQQQNQQQQQQQENQDSQQQGQGEQQSQSAERQQGSQQKQADAQQQQNSTSESNQKSTSKDPKTGYGHQDGSKEIAKAKELEAMGKISELIGQRSQTLTGEIMLETKSSQQHDLKTAYTDTNANHGESGSELRRDEIPVELQPYIERYFTKIRQGQSRPTTAAPLAPAPPVAAPAK